MRYRIYNSLSGMDFNLTVPFPSTPFITVHPLSSNLGMLLKSVRRWESQVRLINPINCVLYCFALDAPPDLNGSGFNISPNPSFSKVNMNVWLLQMCSVEFGCYGRHEFAKRGDSKRVWISQSFAWYREYLSGLLIVFFLTCVGKVLVGEPRPHFLDTCKPFQAFNCTSG